VKKALKNVWYDTAASPLLYPTGKIFRVALQCLDHHKILYASDYPLLLYPRRQSEPDFRPFLEEIAALSLDSNLQDDILGHNAAQLLGLAPSQEPTNRSLIAGSPAEPQDDDPSMGEKITEEMAITLVAHTWPETRLIFDKYHLPWQENAIPFWEPIVQSACARGMGSEERRRLLRELNEAIGES
jgi:hypothetical protein